MRGAPRFRRRIASARGAALVELSASILVLLMVLAFTADFARVYHNIIDLENAARAGAQYGLTDSAHPDLMEAAAKASWAAAMPPGTPTLDAHGSQNCECRGNDGTLYTPPLDCTFDCPDTLPEQHLVVKVTVNASYTFKTFSRVLPIPTAGLTITRTATLRAQ